MEKKVRKSGYFVVSLDFELFWGMADKYTLKEYGENVRGVRTALPRILELFTKYDIHATWATVGMLMAHSHEELRALMPPQNLRPTYSDPRMSSYHYIEETHIGKSESDDVYHYGSSLVELILKTRHQELANHTFSHMYILDGNTNMSEVLAHDLDLHASISNTYNTKTTSIVFPRNQVNAEALRMCFKKGMTAYRGNENHILYSARTEREQSLVIRAFRLLDHYINISGHHTYPLPSQVDGLPRNIPSSQFLRPFMSLLSFLEPLRMYRIKSSMTHAAKRGEIFHLWWHPHNFGINQEQNFKNLTTLLEHYKKLQTQYGMRSTSMRDIITIVDESTA